jgi:hypothetical protein
MSREGRSSMGAGPYVKDENDVMREVILQSGIGFRPIYTPKMMYLGSAWNRIVFRSEI